MGLACLRRCKLCRSNSAWIKVCYLKTTCSCFSMSGRREVVFQTIFCLRSRSSKNNPNETPRNNTPLTIVKTPTYIELRLRDFLSFSLSLVKKAYSFVLILFQTCSLFFFAKGISITITRMPRTIIRIPQANARYLFTFRKSFIVYKTIS